MARNIKQYRYYSEIDSERNQPKELVKANLVNGKVFEDLKGCPIIQLGIQALPGTKFYLNDGIEPVIIGYTGIYELDLDSQTEIFKLTFNKDSMDLIDSNPNGYLIVDVLYESIGEV